MNDVSVAFDNLNENGLPVFEWIKNNVPIIGRLEEIRFDNDGISLEGNIVREKFDLSFDQIIEQYGAMFLEGTLGKISFPFGTKYHNNSVMGVDYDLKEEKDPEYLKRQCLEIFDLSDKAKYGAIYTYGENRLKVNQKSVSVLSRMFISVIQPWYFVVSPNYYEGKITKEQLLAAPAFKVEELEDDCVAVQIWEHPYDVLSKETQEKMLECAQYFIQIIEGDDYLERRRQSYEIMGKDIPELGVY